MGNFGGLGTSNSAFYFGICFLPKKIQWQEAPSCPLTWRVLVFWNGLKSAIFCFEASTASPSLAVIRVTMLPTSLISSLLLASFVSAAPAKIGLPSVDPQALLCKIPIISKLLCNRASSGTCPAIKTKLGVASGVVTPGAANRYTVKYASAERWTESRLATTWTFP